MFVGHLCRRVCNLLLSGRKTLLMFLFRPQLLVAEIPPRGIVMAHYFLQQLQPATLQNHFLGKGGVSHFSSNQQLQKSYRNLSSTQVVVWLKHIKHFQQKPRKQNFSDSFFPVPVREMTQLKMVLESTLYSCGQMKLEAFEQSEISSFTVDSGWTACLPFASLAMQITAREIASMLLL